MTSGKLQIQGVSSATVKHFYDLCNLRLTHGSIGFQQFFYLLRQAGAEQGMVDAADADLEDYVSITVLQDMAKGFIQKIGDSMRMIGYEKKWLKENLAA